MGNLLGLKASATQALSRLYRRRIPSDRISTQEFNRELTEISHEIGRQTGALVNRSGQVELVVVGDAGGILLPDMEPSRGLNRLRGLRYIHTHFKNERLTEEDLTDLSLLRLDLILAVTVDNEGYPGPAHLAHLLPPNPEDKLWEIYQPILPGQLDIDFMQLINSLEEEFARHRPRLSGRDQEGAILIQVIEANSRRRRVPAAAEPEIDAMAELRELTRSAGLDVLDEVIQKRPRIHPRTILGPGKLRAILTRVMQLGATTLIFDHNLSPAQVNALQKITELKVIDRTQLILDIFAQRASSREGKIQVELAQLQYVLPRLVGHGVDMSRLMGGIGGRGPGETKLEIDRRRVHERITRLESQLEGIRKSRAQRRTLRDRRGVPVVSIIGYTNVGKSTLLNALTGSEMIVEDKLFATLDPSSRRLRFPRERELIITDTVGFIRDLPENLMEAFRATLEELESADLFLHVVDAASPSMDGQIRAVEKTIEQLGFQDTRKIMVLNKIDLLSDLAAAALQRRFPEAAMISARDRTTFPPLLQAIEKSVWKE